MSRRRPLGPKFAELDALYAELPTIDCHGACHASCGPIAMTKLEHVRVRQAGVDIPDGSALRGVYDCPALTLLKRCAVYDVRPLICRIWGLTKRMPCTYGCRPSRWLTEAEAYGFIARAHEIERRPGRPGENRGPRP